MPSPAPSRALGTAVALAAAALGLLLLVLTALLGLGALVWAVGALLLLVAGTAGGLRAYRRAAGRGAAPARAALRGLVPVAVGLVACVVALALPGGLRAHENGRLVAWTAPGSSSVVLAEHGSALTLEPDPDGPDSVVVGRDLDDGRVRWRTRLRVAANPESAGAAAVWRRVGDVALVVGRPFGFAAVDLRTGRLLWQDTAPGLRIAAVATTRAVASTRCVDAGDADDAGAGQAAPASDGAAVRDDAGPPCTADARDLRTGRVLWSAPVAPEGVYLGAPTVQRSARSGPLWPGRWVLTVEPDPRAGRRGPDWRTPSSRTARPLGWAVRALETGRTVRRGTTAGLSGLALAGGGLLRQTTDRDSAVPRTTWSLLDPATGRVRWTRTLAAGPSDPGGPGLGIWLPTGWLPVARERASAEFGVRPDEARTAGGGHALRLLDPRTGRLAAVRTGAATRLEIPRPPDPEVTAATVAGNPRPDAAVVLTAFAPYPARDHVLLARPGRPGPARGWTDAAGSDDYAVTATLVARQRDHDLGDLTGAEQADAIEVRDARTGEVVNRVRGWGTGELAAVGERLVFDDRPNDDETVTRVLRATP